MRDVGGGTGGDEGEIGKVVWEIYCEQVVRGLSNRHNELDDVAVILLRDRLACVEEEYFRACAERSRSD